MINLIKFAEQGDADSQFELGVRYANGDGVTQDYAKAAFWFEKAARQGHETAQYNIAQCYEKELGVVQNYSIAFRWYERAGEQGDIDAIANMALYYYLGQGIPKDYEKAVYYWEISANGGNSRACYNLGICHRDGTGVWKDLYEAEKWLLKAQELGHPKASHTLEQMKRVNSSKCEVRNNKLDLVLKSTHHQRYQNEIPVMGSQYCNRMIKIEHKTFKEMFNGLDVTPKEGFIVTMWNTDIEPPTQHMQPKLMEMVYSDNEEIWLKGVTLKTMGNIIHDYTDYGITLHLRNRNVVKCTLHLHDRDVDIEYDEFTR